MYQTILVGIGAIILIVAINTQSSPASAATASCTKACSATECDDEGCDTAHHPDGTPYCNCPNSGAKRRNTQTLGGTRGGQMSTQSPSGVRRGQ
jgi:hypothetical protein